MLQWRLPIFSELFSAELLENWYSNCNHCQCETAEAAQGIRPSFFAVPWWSCLGMAVVGASLLSVTLVFWLIGESYVLLGFGFCASVLLFFKKQVVVSLPKPLISVLTWLVKLN